MRLSHRQVAAAASTPSTVRDRTLSVRNGASGWCQRDRDREGADRENPGQRGGKGRDGCRDHPRCREAADVPRRCCWSTGEPAQLRCVEFHFGPFVGGFRSRYGNPPRCGRDSGPGRCFPSGPTSRRRSPARRATDPRPRTCEPPGGPCASSSASPCHGRCRRCLLPPRSRPRSAGLATRFPSAAVLVPDAACHTDGLRAHARSACGARRRGDRRRRASSQNAGAEPSGDAPSMDLHLVLLRLANNSLEPNLRF